MFLNQSFELKSENLTHTIIRIKEPDISQFEKDFVKAASQAPKLFTGASFIVILLFGELVTNVKLRRIEKTIESVGGNLIGIRTSATEQITEAIKAKIKVIQNNKPTAHNSKKETPQPVGREIMTHGKVRSGTQVYAKGKDIVICGDVSHGSEIIATGNIFIFGALYGKAIAGAEGDTKTQIFCQEFAPELISIGGIYIINEDFTEEFIKNSVCARMENDRIKLSIFKQKNTQSIA